MLSLSELIDQTQDREIFDSFSSTDEIINYIVDALAKKEPIDALAIDFAINDCNKEKIADTLLEKHIVTYFAYY